MTKKDIFEDFSINSYVVDSIIIASSRCLILIDIHDILFCVVLTGIKAKLLSLSCILCQLYEYGDVHVMVKNSVQI